MASKIDLVKCAEALLDAARNAPPKRGRGRPRKAPAEPAPPKRPRGRPPSAATLARRAAEAAGEPQPAKRPRGRPRKAPAAPAEPPAPKRPRGRPPSAATLARRAAEAAGAVPPKRGRGRPRKSPIAEKRDEAMATVENIRPVSVAEPEPEWMAQARGRPLSLGAMMAARYLADPAALARTREALRRPLALGPGDQPKNTLFEPWQKAVEDMERPDGFRFVEFSTKPVPGGKKLREISEEKKTTLLERARKGAVAQFSESDWFHLWIATHPNGAVRKGIVFRTGEIEIYKSEWEQIKQSKKVYRSPSEMEVNSVQLNTGYLPSGKLLDVTDAGKRFNAPWRALVEAIELVDDAGKSYTFAPEPQNYEVSQGLEGRLERPFRLQNVYDDIYKAFDWNGLASRTLGVEVLEPAAPRTQDNTGTCSICLKNIKLGKGEKRLKSLALHGYSRPGDGQVYGNCEGMKFPAYEISSEGSAYWEIENTKFLQSTESRLEEAKAATEIVQYRRGKPPRTLTAADREFEYEKQNWIWELEQDIRRYKQIISLMKTLVEKWRPRNLPKEGQIALDYARIMRDVD